MSPLSLRLGRSAPCGHTMIGPMVGGRDGFGRGLIVIIGGRGLMGRGGNGFDRGLIIGGWWLGPWATWWSSGRVE